MEISEDFDIFVAIVDAGSISAASRALRHPRASLSRQLARLEARMGVRLINRTTRRMTLTPAGQALYPRARALLDTATAAVEAVRRLDDVPRGVLRIASAPLHSHIVGELVAAYLAEHRHVEIELVSAAAHVDLAAEQIDVALRGGVVRDPALIARTLLRSEMIAVASTTYLDQAGRLATPADLVDHACLRGFVAGQRPATVWPLRDGGTVSVAGAFVTNDLMAMRGVVEAGGGIGLLPRQFVAPGLADGSLQQVLPDSVGLPVRLSLVWLEREFLAPKVRAFIELAARWADTGRFEHG